MKKLIPLLLIVLGYAYFGSQGTEAPVNPPQPPMESGQASGLPATKEPALHDGQQAHGSGIVTRILADDNDGSRHQRFILELPSGRTLLVAHNIDVAPRVMALQRGDIVEFNGVFETNERGGVIHWTHHDPQRRHVGGWLQHNGQRYD